MMKDYYTIVNLVSIEFIDCLSIRVLHFYRAGHAEASTGTLRRVFESPSHDDGSVVATVYLRQLKSEIK
jgi:hypothetical protein